MLSFSLKTFLSLVMLPLMASAKYISNETALEVLNQKICPKCNRSVQDVLLIDSNRSVIGDDEFKFLILNSPNKKHIGDIYSVAFQNGSFKGIRKVYDDNQAQPILSDSKEKIFYHVYYSTKSSTPNGHGRSAFSNANNLLSVLPERLRNSHPKYEFIYSPELTSSVDHSLAQTDPEAWAAYKALGRIVDRSLAVFTDVACDSKGECSFALEYPFIGEKWEGAELEKILKPRYNDIANPANLPMSQIISRLARILIELDPKGYQQSKVFVCHSNSYFSSAGPKGGRSRVNQIQVACLWASKDYLDKLISTKKLPIEVKVDGKTLTNAEAKEFFGYSYKAIQFVDPDILPLDRKIDHNKVGLGKVSFSWGDNQQMASFVEPIDFATSEMRELREPMAAFNRIFHQLGIGGGFSERLYEAPSGPDKVKFDRLHSLIQSGRQIYAKNADPSPYKRVSITYLEKRPNMPFSALEIYDCSRDNWHPYVVGLSNIFVKLCKVQFTR